MIILPWSFLRYWSMEMKPPNFIMLIYANNPFFSHNFFLCYVWQFFKHSSVPLVDGPKTRETSPESSAWLIPECATSRFVANSHQPTGMITWNKLWSRLQLCLILSSQAGKRVENALLREVWCLGKSEMEHRFVPRTRVNSLLDGDGLAPVPCPLVPWFKVTEEEQQVVPNSSLCSPGALVGLAHAWWQGCAHWGVCSGSVLHARTVRNHGALLEFKWTV